MKFYIAFSIHGSNKFHVAVIDTRFRQRKFEDTNEFVKRALGEEFFAINSRRVSYDYKKDGIKVGWCKLNNKSGTPLASASWVSRRFKELVALGWKIVEDDKMR